MLSTGYDKNPTNQRLWGGLRAWGWDDSRWSNRGVHKRTRQMVGGKIFKIKPWADVDTRRNTHNAETLHKKGTPPEKVLEDLNNG